MGSETAPRAPEEPLRTTSPVCCAPHATWAPFPPQTEWGLCVLAAAREAGPAAPTEAKQPRAHAGEGTASALNGKQGAVRSAGQSRSRPKTRRGVPAAATCPLLTPTRGLVRHGPPRPLWPRPVSQHRTSHDPSHGDRTVKQLCQGGLQGCRPRPERFWRLRTPHRSPRCPGDPGRELRRK